MPVTTEQIDPCKVALTITVEPDKVKAAREKAYQQFAREVQVPGFRKGKVPPQMVRNFVDKDRVKQRTLELAVGPAYADALKEAEVTPFGGLEPEMELVEMEDNGPLVFKAQVPLAPVITLGLYKGLDVERRTLEVADEDVERQIDDLRTRNAEFPQITDRPVQLGDVILSDIAVVVHGDEEDTSESRSAVIEVGKNIEDFDKGLAGMEIGETKNIDAHYPEDFNDERLRGKDVTFTVTVNEIREKNLPELDDAFVQKVHQTAKTPEEFRAAIKESLEKAAQEMADNQLEFDIVGKIVQSSQIHYPDALVRVEMRSDYSQLAEYLEREKMSFEDYLETNGQTREEFEAQVANNASARIRNSLVLSEVARQEELKLEEEEVEQALEAEATRRRASVAALKAFLEKNQQMDRFRDQALTEKILNFLKDQATITERSITSEELRQQNEAGQAVVSTEESTEPETPLEPAAPLAVTTSVTGRRGRKTAETVENTASTESAEETAETTENA